MPFSVGSQVAPPFISDEKLHRREIARWMNDTAANVNSISASVSAINTSITTLALSLSAVTTNVTSLMAGAAFRAYQSSAQTVAAVTFTQILFATEIYDSENNFAASSFTAPKAGVYHFTACVGANAALAQRSSLVIYVNGVANTTIDDSSAAVAGDVVASGSASIYLNAADVITVFIYYSAATTTTIGNRYTYFCGNFIRG